MPAVLIALIVVFGLVALVLVVSSFIPRDHAVSVRARYARSPREVWETITDFESYPSWNPAIVSVDVRRGADGAVEWDERMKHGVIPLALEQHEPPRRLVVRIRDPQGKMAFGGTWTWVLRDVPEGTEVTLTENGYVRNPFFRVVAHFVLGYTRTMEGVLQSLGARFGETTETRVV